jgi:hypothetical protein
MSLYEVVFDAGDEHEMRFTDDPLSIGDVLEMRGVYWEVVRDCAAEEQPRARYECRRAQGRPEEEIRRRAKETRARLERLQHLVDSTAKPSPSVSTATAQELPQTS